MRIAITGASGLVGTAAVKAFSEAGDEVVRVIRATKDGEGVVWDPLRGTIDAAGLEGADAVLHLAGESIAQGRWTAAQKEKIRTSRVAGTELLSRTLSRLARPPRVLVSASAIGFYGDRDEEELRESSARGAGFLPEVCRAWEEATRPAEDAGLRVVRMRLGIVLARQGGALAKMLLPFRLGLGGVLGRGRQWMSWITLTDVVRAIQHVIRTETVRGPVNFVAPAAATNRQFTKTLGRVLGRPTIFPLPAFAARLMFGEMADALLLSSAKVTPAALRDSGFSFAHGELETALRHVLCDGV